MPVTTQEAREASLSRVTTLDKLVPPVDPPKADADPPEGQKDEGQKPGKKPINERITQLVERRREAEEKAAQAEARAQDLESQLEAMKVKADPIVPGDRPVRTAYANDDEYLDALADYKSKQAIAKREQEQATAQAQAEFDAIEKQWGKSIEKAKADISDYQEVVEAAEIPISDVLAVTLKEHPQGAELLYFFAKHPEEARKVSRMRPVAAVLAMNEFARELREDDPPPAKPKRTSNAPEPIEPVRQSAASAPGQAASFDEYRARRMAEKKK